MRRFGAALAALAVCSVPALSGQQRQPRAPNRAHYTFVIVHGAWGGGWDWLAVDSMLTRHGHKVVRVTLTGLGERHHLASPDIGLSTHIEDVVSKISGTICTTSSSWATATAAW